MNKVLFRTDGNTQMGLGHLMRCLALAQQLDASDVEVVFAIRQTSLPFCQSRHDWVGRIVIVPDCESQQEVQWLQTQPEFNQADWLVLDGYQFDSDYQQALKSAGKPLAIFDDNNDAGLLHADLIINGASQASQLGYEQTAPNAAYCLGEQYRVLRREFSLVEPVPFSERKDLVISFGGSDPLDITLRLLKELEHLQADMPIRVITGAAYAGFEDLKAYVQNTALNIQHLHNHQQMADCFGRARLAVSAAGGSQFELLACATPSILAIVADNQRQASQQASQQGWCEVLDMTAEQNVSRLAKTALELWHHPQKLLSMYQQAFARTDTGGASRVVEAMLSLTGKQH
jgi:UDP-2,4-diacetamido-2,4,6-trideoxy-beta-L-altropyranose hydrolase